MTLAQQHVWRSVCLLHHRHYFKDVPLCSDRLSIILHKGPWLQKRPRPHFGAPRLISHPDRQNAAAHELLRPQARRLVGGGAQLLMQRLLILNSFRQNKARPQLSTCGAWFACTRQRTRCPTHTCEAEVQTCWHAESGLDTYLTR